MRGASGQHSPVLLKVVLQSAASLTNVSPLGTRYLIATPLLKSAVGELSLYGALITAPMFGEV